jgi:N-methylhydantoinase A/oxoprolinase/acetone carboxylase beta subunit
VTAKDVTAQINVDIGGTFTDCFVQLSDGRSSAVKTPTTGYRLAVGFEQALNGAADELGLPLEELLTGTQSVRYSTTVAMNTLLQRSGPKLALIVTQGFEDLLEVSKGASWTDAAALREIRNVARATKPDALIDRELVIGVRERLDCFGNVIRPLDEDHFRASLRGLVDQGVRGFVVVLLFSYVNPVHEHRIRELIEEEYPEVFLGAMPIMLSCDVAPKRWEYTRANTVALNTYLHQAMWEELSGMSDTLRDRGYERGIMLVHNTGGMAEVYRTSAVQTFNGGPVAGLIGGAAVGAALGFDNVLVTDMGGTSFDIGLVVKGSTRFYQFRPLIDRYWADLSMLETRSIGAGGGSIAWINDAMGGRLEIGPQGAGSMPGPACYGMGGEEPTVTDADVVLGYINPDGYFGGRIKLDVELASQAIQSRIADPLGISVEEAAARIKLIVDANMADVIARETFMRGYDPRDFILFAYGGAGPTHCVGYGGNLGAQKIVVMPSSPLFCAWGSSTMPVAHLYEASRRFELLRPGSMEPMTSYDEFNGVVEDLERQARRDLSSEGFDPDQATFTLDLTMKYGGQIHVHRTASPVLRINHPDDVRALSEAFEREYSSFFSAVNVFPEGGVEIHSFALRAEMPRPEWELASYPPAAGDAAPVKTGSRSAYWTSLGRRVDTPVYLESGLDPGMRIAGPAIIEAPYTTTVIDPRYVVDVDSHRNLVITRS